MAVNFKKCFLHIDKEADLSNENSFDLQVVCSYKIGGTTVELDRGVIVCKQVKLNSVARISIAYISAVHTSSVKKRRRSMENDIEGEQGGVFRSAMEALEEGMFLQHRKHYISYTLR
jgi:hypothetical protein